MTTSQILENWLKKSVYKFKIIYGYTFVLKLKIFINAILELIEIGALHLPLKTYKAKVTYVDRMDVKDLRKHYPELRKFPLTRVDVIDNGETLRKIKNESQDFVIANHFIEHCENPIVVLKNHLRVLKRNRTLYWVIPDKRYTLDNIRNLTSIDHVNNDFKRGGKYSRKAHYDEWVEKIMGLQNKDAVKKSQELMEAQYSIHFHVWTSKSFLEFLLFTKKTYKFPFTILKVVANINEFIVILKKTR